MGHEGLTTDTYPVWNGLARTRRAAACWLAVWTVFDILYLIMADRPLWRGAVAVIVPVMVTGKILYHLDRFAKARQGPFVKPRQVPPSDVETFLFELAVTLPIMFFLVLVGAEGQAWILTPPHVAP